MGISCNRLRFLPRPTCYPTWYCEIATGAKRPRNDNSGAFTMMTLPCTSCQRSAGSGCPRPYDRLLRARAVIIIRGGGDAAGDDLQRGVGGADGRLGDELVLRAGEILSCFQLPSTVRARTGGLQSEANVRRPEKMMWV